MSGPNPPEPDSYGRHSSKPADEPTQDVAGGQEGLDQGSYAGGQGDDQGSHPGDTEVHQAYSAPESEQFTSGPYVPPDPALYDYDAYEPATELVREPGPPPPRWPWVVGVTAIIAAIALVVSVSLLVTRTETKKTATPATTTTSKPPVQDEITKTTPPPPPPPPTTTEAPPPPPPPQTVTVTKEPPPPPPPQGTPEAPAPATTTTVAPPPTTTTTPAGPRQITYSVTGTKAPGDIITVTYVDASGRQRTQRNVYIPWSFTVTPISNSDVGSVQASSLFLVSRLNCSITTSDGQVLSANSNNSPQTSC
jgi:Mycobacterium membrane protein